MPFARVQTCHKKPVQECGTVQAYVLISKEWPYRYQFNAQYSIILAMYLTPNKTNLPLEIPPRL